MAAVAVGCGGDDPTPTPEPTPAPAIEVGALDAPFRYEPSELTVESGDSITIRLVNQGTVEHDFTIDEFDFQVATAVGETAEGTLTGVEPGTYRFYCTVPGHAENGMVGELVVTG
jgi:plastocyanin